MSRRSDRDVLTDEQWERLAPLTPCGCSQRDSGLQAIASINIRPEPAEKNACSSISGGIEGRPRPECRA
ncbi:hypothetical protein MKK65_04835 [Methylobacterium sp. J-001]|nr:hypothetical protein [Methylobacterium sp. J-001]MCJ2115925.1 hypothetical protein [Methylobacterium sp. J-001]